MAAGAEGGGGGKRKLLGDILHKRKFLPNGVSFE